MTEERLAKQLRRRLRVRMLVPRDVVAETSDEDIIDAFVICACCGERIVNGEQLEEAIAQAENAAAFLRITAAMHKENESR